MPEIDIALRDRLDSAHRIIRRYQKWSLAAGIIPAPLLDYVAITGVQLRMLGRLAELYGMRFSDSLGKNLLAGLLGSLVPTNLAWGAVGSVIKAVPLIGPLAGIITLPAFAAASTYAVGVIFTEHFESGGTILDFDPEKVKAHFRAVFDAEHEAAKGGKTEKTRTAAA